MDIDAGGLVFQLKDQSLFKQNCFINGEWVNSDNGDTFDVVNPSDLTVVGTMPNASKKELFAQLMLQITLGVIGKS